MRKTKVFTPVIMGVVLIVSVSTFAAKGKSSQGIDDIAYPVVAAHRGGASIHPENTLAALKDTAESHPGMPLEMDIRAISDGTLVVMHDETVERVAVDATGLVADMTRHQWDTLQIQHPAGGEPAPATTLEEVVDEFKGTGAPLIIEIKDPTIANSFIEMMLPIRDQVIAQSFDVNIVDRLVQSGLSTLQLSGTPTRFHDGIEHVGVSNVNVTKQYVDQAHAKGIKVWVWGEDVTADMVDTDTRGVDGFIADNPTR
ncbi:glycerophosphodiester phosphodiesterase [Brevibacterium linens]|uniref:glycerophosphodiester phosphodiesterase n=1 Tax=Brevibacterium linens TaxID=1703 RepID=UPI003BF55A82